MIIITFLYFGSFLSMLLGWFSEQIESHPKVEKIKLVKIKLPNILLCVNVSAYIFLFLMFHLGFYISNKWLIWVPVVPTLISLEYIWRRNAKIIKGITKHLSYKISLISSVVIIHFYSASFSSSYLEQLTGAPASIFNTYDYLLTFAISLSFWLVIFQFFTIGFSVYIFIQEQFYSYKKDTKYTFNLKEFKKQTKLKTNHSVESFHAIFILLMLCVFEIRLGVDVIYKKALPMVIDNYFVQLSYHDNEITSDNRKWIDGKNIIENRICKNLENNTKILLLPNGKVSIAESSDEKHKKNLFKIGDCAS